MLGQQNPDVESFGTDRIGSGTGRYDYLPLVTNNLNIALNRHDVNDVTYLTYAGVDHGGILAAADDDIEPIIEGWLPTGN